MAENTYAGEHTSKKTRRDGVRNGRFIPFLLPTVVDVYTGMQAIYVLQTDIFICWQSFPEKPAS